MPNNVLPNCDEKDTQFCSYYLCGELRSSSVRYDVCCPDDGSLVATVSRPSAEEVLEALSEAQASLSQTRSLTTRERTTILNQIANFIETNSDAIARTLALEAAKPISLARSEIIRTCETFREAARVVPCEGTIINLDTSASGRGHLGFVVREPVGVIAAITPFNFPLNLVAHKVAPAIAAGCPIVLKPATQTPLSAFWIAEAVRQTSWPKKALSVLPMDSSSSGILVKSTIPALLTFTGSGTVGWELKKRAGAEHITLELGGNAAVIVHVDADISSAAEKMRGAFMFGGQSCISIQRVFAHEDIFDEFVIKVVEMAKGVKVGHPLDESSNLSSVITRNDAERIRRLIESCEQLNGCVVAHGGNVQESRVEPTVVLNCDRTHSLWQTEVFAPVLFINKYRTFDEAIAMVNDSDFGLQAAVFTKDLNLIMRAAKEIEVGGIMINESPSFRVDAMPYGGVKQSGLGKEGPKYAVEEMTRIKLVVINS